MANDISSVTGEVFYSGTWSDIQQMLRVINIGDGKMAQITQPTVNNYQEMVDREIDAILEDTYRTPFRAMNQVQPDGTTKRVLPGDLVRSARMWTCSMLMLSEFQQLSQNLTDQMTNFQETAQKLLFEMKRFSHRLPRAYRKSHWSHTVPATLQPPAIPEYQG